MHPTLQAKTSPQIHEGGEGASHCWLGAHRHLSGEPVSLCARAPEILAHSAEVLSSLANP